MVVVRPPEVEACAPPSGCGASPGPAGERRVSQPKLLQIPPGQQQAARVEDIMAYKNSIWTQAVGTL